MIITPRGLIVYLPRDFAFALMARLFPKVSAFEVLESVQGVSKTHGAFATIAGLGTFALRLTPSEIAAWSLSVPLGVFALRHLGVWILPGQVRIPTLYSRITGFGVVTAIVLAIGLASVGIAGTAAFFGSRLALEVITLVVDRAVGRRMGIALGADVVRARAGAMYFAPAKDFIRVYRLYASRTGASQDVAPTSAELRPENWADVWNEFATEWPQVAARYPSEGDAAEYPLATNVSRRD